MSRAALLGTMLRVPTEMASASRPSALRSLLIPTDLSAVADRVVGRAARLPLAHDARLTLLHVVPSGHPMRAQRRAEAAARKALAIEAAHLEEHLPAEVTVTPVVQVGVAAAEISRRAEEEKTELVIMGRGTGRVLDGFLGSTAERVIRRGQLPVLVVRLAARAPYHRPALALALDQPARALLDMLLRVLSPPRPAVEVIHAFDAPYESMIYPSLSSEDADEYRGHRQKSAQAELTRLLQRTLTEARVAARDAPAWKTHLRLGSARLVIERAVKKAGTDLLALGTRGHGGLAQAFLGSVSGDVLRAVACDVLVVPPRGRAAGRG